MKIFLFVLFLLPQLCFSQKVLKSGYDKSLNKYVIETSVVQAKIGLDDILGLWLRSVDTTIYVIATGVGYGAVNINQGDELIFDLTNDGSVVATSLTLQKFATGRLADSYTHEYCIAPAALMKLVATPLKAVRMHVNKRFITIEVKEKRSTLLSDLVKVFLTEYNAKRNL